MIFYQVLVILMFINCQGKGIRVDNGFEQEHGYSYYDPMLAKLITYGETREEAIEIMINAIDNYLVRACKQPCLLEYVMGTML
jgi:acetyl/propionyl-CoA carboxylase alpha subunit